MGAFWSGRSPTKTDRAKTTERPLVLATTSRYRRALLDEMGLAYIAAAPDFVEDHHTPLSPDELVVAFARGKAQSLSERYPDALIVAADQVAELDGRMLIKPGTVGRAIDQLLALSGRTHRLVTAVALCAPSLRHLSHRLVVTEMTMRRLTSAQARAYVEREQPLDCAGSYKIESAGLALFSAMSGTDHSAIIGLPVTAVGELLAEVGEDLLERVLTAPQL